MNVFFEENGQFKVGSIVSQNASSYHVNTIQGKRIKLKTAQVLFSFDTPLASFLTDAQQEAEHIDIELLWQSCEEQTFSAQCLAKNYYGHTASPIELAAMLIALYNAPIYFYKKTKTDFKAAPASTVQQALSTLARKQAEQAQIQTWANDLIAGKLPDEMALELPRLLHLPNKQLTADKAFAFACEQLNFSALELATHIGAIDSTATYLHDRFTYKYYPQGTQLADIPIPTLAELPIATCQALSIDDEDTTEIDDALSLTLLDNHHYRIGIHIAVPSLAIEPNSEIEQMIAARQSTAYFPTGKIPMLPDNWIDAFSLDEGALKPALSLYADFSPNAELLHCETKLERVNIARNLRIQSLETLLAKEQDFPERDTLNTLYQTAIALQKQRGMYQENSLPKFDYQLSVNPQGKVCLSKRQRGGFIDTLVSEMMILANSYWAGELSRANLAGLFRIQTTGRVQFSTQADKHVGMGLNHYAWFTSPLRRACDYINQKQLLSLITDHAPRYQPNDHALFAALRDFESTYNAYASFQRRMERYWSLVYLEQQQLTVLTAKIYRDNLVHIDGLPFTATVMDLPTTLSPNTAIYVHVQELNANFEHIILKYHGIFHTES